MIFDRNRNNNITLLIIKRSKDKVSNLRLTNNSIIFKHIWDVLSKYANTIYTISPLIAIKSIRTPFFPQLPFSPSPSTPFGFYCVFFAGRDSAKWVDLVATPKSRKLWKLKAPRQGYGETRTRRTPKWKWNSSTIIEQIMREKWWPDGCIDGVCFPKDSATQPEWPDTPISGGGNRTAAGRGNIKKKKIYVYTCRRAGKRMNRAGKSFTNAKLRLGGQTRINYADALECLLSCHAPSSTATGPVAPPLPIHKSKPFCLPYSKS